MPRDQPTNLRRMFRTGGTAAAAKSRRNSYTPEVALVPEPKYPDAFGGHPGQQPMIPGAPAGRPGQPAAIAQAARDMGMQGYDANQMAADPTTMGPAGAFLQNRRPANHAAIQERARQQMARAGAFGQPMASIGPVQLPMAASAQGTRLLDRRMPQMQQPATVGMPTPGSGDSSVLQTRSENPASVLPDGSERQRRLDLMESGNVTNEVGNYAIPGIRSKGEHSAIQAAQGASRDRRASLNARRAARKLGISPQLAMNLGGAEGNPADIRTSMLGQMNPNRRMDLVDQQNQLWQQINAPTVPQQQASLIQDIRGQANIGGMTPEQTQGLLMGAMTGQQPRVAPGLDYDSIVAQGAAAGNPDMVEQAGGNALQAEVDQLTAGQAPGHRVQEVISQVPAEPSLAQWLTSGGQMGPQELEDQGVRQAMEQLGRTDPETEQRIRSLIRQRIQSQQQQQPQPGQGGLWDRIRHNITSPAINSVMGMMGR